MICGSCKSDKSSDSFYSNKRNNNGKNGSCKACCKKQQAARLLRNKQNNLANPKDISSLKKICPRCKLEKSLSSYTKNIHTVDGRASKCRDCSNFLKRLKTHKISAEKYNELLVKQNFNCSGCSVSLDSLKSKDVCIDHCHVYGHVRGILCNNCNLILGLACDDAKTLGKLAGYLRMDRYINIDKDSKP